MSSEYTGSLTGSMDLDIANYYVYSTNHENIKLYGYSQPSDNRKDENDGKDEDGDDGDTDDNEYEAHKLSYLNRIPIVNTYKGETINPDNLMVYTGGTRLLLSDANNYDSILNLDIERGIVVNKKAVHDPGLSTDVSFKVRKFDYNNQGSHAAYEKCVVGINNNHVMRFDTSSGGLVSRKSYERSPTFTAVATDISGNVVVGDVEGKIRVYPDIGKKASRCFQGLGDAITNIKISAAGDILATTDDYFLLLIDFIKKGGSQIIYHIGKLDKKILAYLNLVDECMICAQFSNNEETISFSIGKYVFHWDIDRLIKKEQEIRIFEAGERILFHKSLMETGSSSEFVLTDRQPLRFM